MQRREFIGRLGVAAVGAICGSSLSYAQATGSVAHRTIAGTLHGWRSRLSNGIPRYGSGYRQFGKQRAATARQVHTRRLRPLDPAGTRVRGQRCDDRFLARVVSELAGRPATE